MDVVYFLRVVWFLASFLSYALPALVFVVYLFLFSLIFKLVKLLAGLSQLIPQKVWSFRAWRKLFPEWFGVSAHGESRFPNGLVFPRMAKVVSQRVWSFRVLRKLFPNSLGLVVAKIWNKNLSGFWIYNYQGASIGTVSTIFSTHFVLHKKIVLWNKIRK